MSCLQKDQHLPSWLVKMWPPTAHRQEGRSKASGTMSAAHFLGGSPDSALSGSVTPGKHQFPSASQTKSPRTNN